MRDGVTGLDPIDQESLAAHLSRVWGWDLYRETLACAVAGHLAIETGDRVVCRCEHFLSSGGVSCLSGRARARANAGDGPMQRPDWAMPNSSVPVRGPT